MEEKELLEKEQKDEAPKKPIYKKWWFWVIIGVAVLSIAFAGVGSGTQNEETDGEGKLGKYTVSILGYRFAENYDGENVIIVKYNFKNNSDENAAFYLTFDASAYQNGIGLNECYFVDESANYSSDNQTKEIKPGANIDVEEAYLLNDNTSSIDIEVKELFSFSDDVIKKTFVINEGGSQTDNSSKEEQNNQSTETVKNNLGVLKAKKTSVKAYLGNAIDLSRFKDNSFDIVIANMMLYHVPDIHKGLSEVRRVLKSDGAFYCATYGENGIVEYISSLLESYKEEGKFLKDIIRNMQAKQ